MPRLLYSAVFATMMVGLPAHAEDCAPDRALQALIGQNDRLISALIAGRATADRSDPRPATSSITVLSDDLKSQLDAYLRSWVGEHPDVVLEAVNKHMDAKRQAAMPKAADFQARDTEVFAETGTAVGAPSDRARAQLAVFTDFNCHFCKDMDRVLVDLATANPDLRIVYHDMPILAATSRTAALAARAAALQGRYAEFRAALYNTEKIDEQTFPSIADALGLDVDRLKNDMGSTAVASAVDRDVALARSLKIQGTPFIFLRNSDRVFPGAVPRADLEAAISKVRER